MSLRPEIFLSPLRSRRDLHLRGQAPSSRYDPQGRVGPVCVATHANRWSYVWACLRSDPKSARPENRTFGCTGEP